VREDDVAARAYGISPNRYKGLAFAFAGFLAGVSGAFTAHLYSYINYETFTSAISILALTMVILGGRFVG
jgi:branched-chain amino acid transport system permease protein